MNEPLTVNKGSGPPSAQRRAGRFPKGYRARDLFNDFREEQAKRLADLMENLQPKDAIERLVVEQLAGVVSVLKLCIRDMERNGLAKRNGELRQSWNAYLTGLARFGDLLDRLPSRKKDQDRLSAVHDAVRRANDPA